MRASRRTRIAIVAAVLGAAAILAARLLPHAPLSRYAPASTAIHAADGRLLRLTLAADGQYRVWTPLDTLPPDLVDALLLHEDQWYYWHPGVNPVALLRAGVAAALGHGTAGASTLTMQLARRIHGLRTRSAAGKLRQIGAALWLALRHSRREVLEAHLNLLPYGGNVQGVGAASLIYFGRPVAQLSLPELLALVVIPQSPQARNPAGGEPATLRAARLRLLERWTQRHALGDAALRLAREPLRYSGPAQLPFLAPHFTDALLATAPQGATLHSTLDLRLQRLLEDAIARYVEANRDRGIVNASALLVDLRDDAVKAMVGSARYADASIDGQVNGTLAKRSPGSTLKPFLYALAMDQGLIHPQSMLKDAPTAFGPYAPENFDGTFVGPVSARDALIGSRNVPAVALAAQLSQPGFYQFLKSAGIASMASERHYGLSLVLGGGEVTAEELATLYAALGNGGRLRPLRYLRDAPRAAPTRILSPESSFMVLDILRQNPRPDGIETGSSAGRAIAWKTGTSWGFRDAWSAGIIGSHVLVVWVGNFDGHGNPAFVGLRAAAPLFFMIADALDATRPTPAAPGLTPPPTLRQVEVCQASGDLPNRDCPRRVPTWFIPGRSPIRVSTIHRRFRIDTRTHQQACSDTPENRIREEVYEVWPSDLSALFARAGMPRRPPPAPGACNGPEQLPVVSPPRITAPLTGVVYELRAGQPAAGTLRLAATADGTAQQLYWFVDAAFVGAARPGEALAWTPPAAGEYTVSVVDDRGASDLRQIRVGLLP